MKEDWDYYSSGDFFPESKGNDYTLKLGEKIKRDCLTSFLLFNVEESEKMLREASDVVISPERLKRPLPRYMEFRAYSPGGFERVRTDSDEFNEVYWRREIDNLLRAREDDRFLFQFYIIVPDDSFVDDPIIIEELFVRFGFNRTAEKTANYFSRFVSFFSEEIRYDIQLFIFPFSVYSAKPSILTKWSPVIKGSITNDLLTRFRLQQKRALERAGALLIRQSSIENLITAGDIEGNIDTGIFTLRFHTEEDILNFELIIVGNFYYFKTNGRTSEEELISNSLLSIEMSS